MVPIEHVIALSAILFTIGVVGVAMRRNLIIILMSIELMLNAANLAFVGFNLRADYRSFIFNRRSCFSLLSFFSACFFRCRCFCLSCELFSRHNIFWLSI